jgi:hypothetical protein
LLKIDWNIKFLGKKIMAIETGAAVSKQKLVDLKIRLLALKEHL